MSILIDGHNLIPKIKGLTLSDPDDERKLIELLQEYCRLQRKSLEVFFDSAPAGQARSQKFGMVKARFVRRGRTADDAIRERLSQLKNSARNWTVVSSDLQVQAAAHWAGAQVLNSEKFASQLWHSLNAAESAEGEEREPALDDEEIEDWLRLFGGPKDTSSE